MALAGLPVLTQLALNLPALVATLQTGKQLSPAEALAIQNISAEASKDLTLLQALYNTYKANPSPDALQKIESLIQDTNQKLPALLQAAHISDAALCARVTTAVILILTTVSSFASLIPQPPTVAPKTAPQNTVIAHPAVPYPQDLRRQSNQEVCAPTVSHSMRLWLKGR